MSNLLFVYDVMRYHGNRLTHVIRNVNNVDAGGFNEESFVNSVGMPNQMIGGDYLCGEKGMITEVYSSICSWVEVENLITLSSEHFFCKECLNEASFILGVTG